MRPLSTAGGVVVSAALLALVSWPQVAYAAPAGQWGDGVGTSQEDVPAPAAQPEAEEAAESTSEPSEATSNEPKTRTKKKKKKKKRTKKKKSRSSKSTSGDEQAAFESATLDGDRALKRRLAAEQAAKAKINAGKGLKAAAGLISEADLEGDPALMVSAAEAAAAVLDTEALTAEERTRAQEAAKSYAGRAQARIAELEGAEDEFAWLRLGLDKGDSEGLRSRAAEVSSAAAATLVSQIQAPAQAPVAARGPSRSLRVARGEIISGAVLIGLGVSGFALMGSGLRLDVLADRELEAAGIADLADLAPAQRLPFEQQYEQAATLTAVGAVLGIAGSALGGTLMVAGIRDRKRAGKGSAAKSKRAAIQAAPSLSRGAAGLVIGGQF